MTVKDVTKFHKCHQMIECLCVQCFIQDFEFWEGGTLKLLYVSGTVMFFNWLLCKLLMLHQVSHMSTPPHALLSTVAVMSFNWLL